MVALTKRWSVARFLFCFPRLIALCRIRAETARRLHRYHTVCQRRLSFLISLLCLAFHARRCVYYVDYDCVLSYDNKLIAMRCQSTGRLSLLCLI